MEASIETKNTVYLNVWLVIPLRTLIILGLNNKSSPFLMRWRLFVFTFKHLFRLIYEIRFWFQKFMGISKVN